MIELGEETIQLFESIATKLQTNDGKSYYFLPFWFEDKGNNAFLEHRLGSLPKDLEEMLLMRMDG